MTTSATVIDPICGMTVDPAEAAGSSTKDGETFYFCSAGCKATFDATQDSGHSCCCRH